MSTPLFSLVIPTRNRPGLLRYALQSALAQTFDDCEILVSDNSSDSGTGALVGEFRDPRLRYVKTPTDLSMPDSWEFALSNATGRYISYLCDDDAVVPALLENVAALLQAWGEFDLLTWSRAFYVHPSWFDAGSRNTLLFPSCTGRIEQIDGRESVRDLFAFSPRPPTPQMLNSMCSRVLADSIKKETERLFWPPAPDYSFAAGALAAARSILRADRLWGITGAARESIGGSHVYGDSQALGRFMEEFGDSDLLPDVPIPLVTVNGIIAQSLLNVQKRSQRVRELGLHLDIPRYFVLTYGELSRWRANGYKVDNAFRTFWTALRDQSPAVKKAVIRDLRKRPVRRQMRRLINSSRLLSEIEGKIRGPLAASYREGVILSGSEYGFGNIWDCALRFDELSDAAGDLSNRNTLL